MEEKAHDQFSEDKTTQKWECQNQKKRGAGRQMNKFRSAFSLALVLLVSAAVTNAEGQTPDSQAAAGNFAPVRDEAYHSRGSQALSILKQVQPMMAARNYAAAQPLLQNAALLDPDDYSYNVHNYLGLVYENTNQFDPGIVEYKKMLELKPGNELGKNNLANMYCKKAMMLSEAGNTDASQSLLAEAIQLNPSQAMFRNDLGSVMQLRGDLEGAIGQYLQALAIDPKLELATLNLAKCYINIGQFEQAKIYFAKYIQDHPESPKAAEARERLAYLANRAALPDDDKAGPDYYRAATAKGVMKWPPEMMPIKVYIDSGRGIKGCRAAFPEALGMALTAWSQATNNRLSWRMVQSPDQADIVCTFAPTNQNFTNHITDPQEQGEVSSYESFVRDGQRYIHHATLAIATYNSITGRNLTDGEARNVALHEIGHALGLVGHSPNYHDIMFFITNPGGGTVERRLSARDVATMNLLYMNNPGR